MRTIWLSTLMLVALNFCWPHAAVAATCDAGNGGIHLPAGFCATVFADNLGVARHLAVNSNGDVYVALQSLHDGSGIAALRDTKHKGHADVIKYFGADAGTGIGIHDGYLYFASDTEILRYKLVPGRLLPDPKPQVVVSGFPVQHEHSAKTMAFDQSGHLFVNVGAPSNACQHQDRVAGSPGINPCPLLAQHGGIWEFDADKLNQVFGKDGGRYATGIRNAVAITWNKQAGFLYALQMGRDQLYGNWPKLYSEAQSAELPAEEFMLVKRGENFGWPYCYYDQLQKKLLLEPEYGGDGKETGDCARYGQPILAFPGHWAPEAVLFYNGDAFPAAYRNGAFVSFHGSWNRAPLPQAGYKVVFVPFTGARPAGGYQVFADGFAGEKIIPSPRSARFRPMGLAEGPGGALYIGDSQHGRVWRVVFKKGT
ncbi:MAG: PQQ-dependent sugar dehydrogenase [Gammaproteobacteria bacterium]|nr:PQQ-dependent sugar dehydrogenase [Gammaproteobacteria bacterium]